MSLQPANATAFPVQYLTGWQAFKRQLVYFVTRKYLGAFGAVVAIVLIFVAILAPQIATHVEGVVLTTFHIASDVLIDHQHPDPRSAEPALGSTHALNLH